MKKILTLLISCSFMMQVSGQSCSIEANLPENPLSYWSTTNTPTYYSAYPGSNIYHHMTFTVSGSADYYLHDLYIAAQGGVEWMNIAVIVNGSYHWFTPGDINDNITLASGTYVLAFSGGIKSSANCEMNTDAYKRSLVTIEISSIDGYSSCSTDVFFRIDPNSCGWMDYLVSGIADAAGHQGDDIYGDPYPSKRHKVYYSPSDSRWYYLARASSFGSGGYKIYYTGTGGNELDKGYLDFYGMPEVSDFYMGVDEFWSIAGNTWDGTDRGAIYRTYWDLNQSKWVTAQPNTSAHALTSDYTSLIHTGNKVYYVGTDNRVRNLYGTNYANEAVLNYNAPKVKSSDSDEALVLMDGKLYYIGQDLYVYYLVWNNTAQQYYYYRANYNAPKAAEGSDIIVGDNKVFYQDINNKLHFIDGATHGVTDNSITVEGNLEYGDGKIIFNKRIYSDRQFYNIYKDGSSWGSGMLHPCSFTYHQSFEFANGKPLSYISSRDRDAHYMTWSSCLSGKKEEIFMNSNKPVKPVGHERLVNIYPNPANKELNIELVEGGLNITLYNSAGALIRTINSEEGMIITLDIETLPSGLYFIAWSGNGKSGMEKVIKN